MSVGRDDAAAALAMVRRTQQDFGRTLDCGPGYSAAFGGVIGALVAIQGIAMPFRGFVYLPLFLAIGLMARYQRRRFGRFVNGYRAGRTRWVAVGLVLVIAALVFLANWFALDRHQPWMAVPLGLIAAPIGAFGNRAWMRAYNRDLTGA